MACALLAAGGTAPAQAVPSFDHGYRAWSAILAERVHEGGLVDYDGLRRDRAGFDAWLTSLEAVPAADFAAWPVAQREAFWINAYNGYAIQLVLDHAPKKSIRDLGGLFSSVFAKEFIPLGHLHGRPGERLSLGEIEHQILARESPSPLFHFAIVCASASCPELRPAAYTGDGLEQQLADRARKFLADPTRNAPRIRGGVLRVSKIFDWAEDELGQYPGGIRQLLADLGPATWTSDPALGKVRLKYLDYDWKLNAWKPAKDSRTSPRKR